MVQLRNSMTVGESFSLPRSHRLRRMLWEGGTFIHYVVGAAIISLASQADYCGLLQWGYCGFLQFSVSDLRKERYLHKYESLSILLQPLLITFLITSRMSLPFHQKHITKALRIGFPLLLLLHPVCACADNVTMLLSIIPRLASYVDRVITCWYV